MEISCVPAHPAMRTAEPVGIADVDVCEFLLVGWTMIKQLLSFKDGHPTAIGTVDGILVATAMTAASVAILLCSHLP
jgi:hypothetical protein